MGKVPLKVLHVTGEVDERDDLYFSIEDSVDQTIALNKNLANELVILLGNDSAAVRKLSQ